jgi:hypothetical protein
MMRIMFSIVFTLFVVVKRVFAGFIAIPQRGEVMRYRTAVEDIEPNHYVCWMLDLPGCYSSARSREEAMALAPSRIIAYDRWIHQHSPGSPMMDGLFETSCVEEFEAYASEEDPEYLVNALFQDDRRPLAYWDVEIGLRLLEWSRRDLLDVIKGLTAEDLSRSINGEVRGSMMGILVHVCGAENWYVGQFGLDVDWSTLPDDIEGRLGAIRANTHAQLTNLIGEDRTTEHCGEGWSPRKILRRTLWHERAHTEQIARLAAS